MVMEGIMKFLINFDTLTHRHTNTYALRHRDVVPVIGDGWSDLAIVCLKAATRHVCVFNRNWWLLVTRWCYEALM